MSTIGKRKARDEETDSAHPHSSTLFVSNLPYDATSTDLQTAFSDLAPVRSAFVVLDHGSGVSKGVGYVSFSIKEDAQTAFESITASGITINGRHLRVQWADSKVVSYRVSHPLAIPHPFSAKKQDKGPAEIGQCEKRKGNSCTKITSTQGQ